MPHITESATNVPSPRVNVSNPTPEVELNSTFLPTGNNKKMPRKNNRVPGKKYESQEKKRTFCARKQ
jgi:hypothetical protein